jgi:hypothetical protein
LCSPKSTLPIGLGFRPLTVQAALGVVFFCWCRRERHVRAELQRLVQPSFWNRPAQCGYDCLHGQECDMNAINLADAKAHLSELVAVALEHGATLYTPDQRLADAGPELGVPAQMLADSD